VDSVVLADVDPEVRFDAQCLFEHAVQHPDRVGRGEGSEGRGFTRLTALDSEPTVKILTDASAKGTGARASTRYSIT
jgi:hypothetical protein